LSLAILGKAIWSAVAILCEILAVRGSASLSAFIDGRNPRLAALVPVAAILESDICAVLLK
jgi:hypothetical protein